MKIVNNISLIITALLIGFGCNDGFLDREPIMDVTNNNYWKTTAELELYNNGIYDLSGNNSTYLFLTGFANGSNSPTYSNMAMEYRSDNGASNEGTHNLWRNIAAGLNTTSDAYGWNWTLLRRCNVFLDNYSKVDASDDQKNQYAGEAYFFRAWFYMDKIQQFGKAPLVTKSLTEESEELYEKQASRADVMVQVLSDINKAIDYLPNSWSGSTLRVTKDVALALKSRICLFEGTYRKYHTELGLQSTANDWLSECVSASQDLMNGKNGNNYVIYSSGNPDSDLRALFIQPDLSSFYGNGKEVIFYRQYAYPGVAHRQSGYIFAQTAGPSRDFVEDFLCVESDGSAKPVRLSSTYKDDTYLEQFDNRDPRLGQTVLDPRREMEILKTQIGYPRVPGMTGWMSPTGYYYIRSYEYDDAQRGNPQEINDYPLFRYAEVLLNYAEAKAELGTITQADLDASIKPLRDRVNMPKLELNPSMDPKYADEGLPSLLIEIRRERRIELAYENFRYYDLMRWKQGTKLSKRILGTRLEDADYNALVQQNNGKALSITRITVDGKKYIDAYAGTNYAVEKRTFDESKNYLLPIPISEFAKNPNLEQTEGWPKSE